MLNQEYWYFLQYDNTTTHFLLYEGTYYELEGITAYGTDNDVLNLKEFKGGAAGDKDDWLHYINYSVDNFELAGSYVREFDIVQKPLFDSVYYDDLTDMLWTGSNGVYEEGLYLFSRAATDLTDPDIYDSETAAEGSTKPEISTKQAFGIDACSSTNIVVCFAVQGNDMYLVYTDIAYDSGKYYIQRATVSETDSSYELTAVGSARSVEDLGFSGRIMDIAILYDGTVYALVSNVGDRSSSFDGSFAYTSGSTHTYYSRGALLKIEGTSSGFKVVDSLGWTESPRTISPSGDIMCNGFKHMPITAYIPPLADNGTMFYGPQKIIGVKPWELAIADNGANFVMPDSSRNGRLYEHNRIMIVDLHSFKVKSVMNCNCTSFNDAGDYGNVDACAIGSFAKISFNLDGNDSSGGGITNSAASSVNDYVEEK